MGTTTDVGQRTVFNTSYPVHLFAEKVTVATTRTQIYDEDKAGWITIKAHADNAGNVTLGDATISADDGYILAANEEITIEHNKLSDLYVITDEQTDHFIYIIGSYKG